MSTKATTAMRKYWKPVLATGASGTSVIIWFEEIIVLGLDILAVLSLLLLVGPIYLFNEYVFKSAMPRLNDKSK